MTHHATVQDHLELRATELREAAQTLPDGGERDALLHKAVKVEAASLIIERWLSSPGLRQPR
jgi:hypothetical protein